MFLKLGVNPGGNDLSLQSLNRQSPLQPWFKAVNYDDPMCPVWNGQYNEFTDQISSGLVAQIGELLFRRLFYSLEASGLATAVVRPLTSAPNLGDLNIALHSYADDILNAVVRILGSKYRYTTSEFNSNNALQNANDFPGAVKKYLKKITKVYISPNDDWQPLGEWVRRELRRSIGNLCPVDAYGNVEVVNLYLRASAADDPVWVCNKCNRPHLQWAAGICTGCYSRMEVNSKLQCISLWENNYLAFHAAKHPRESIRLHCEELTGQTDDQFERQRHFRNVVLNREGQSVVRQIDLLSVTTTLEVGVDIGAL